MGTCQMTRCRAGKPAVPTARTGTPPERPARRSQPRFSVEADEHRGPHRWSPARRRWPPAIFPAPAAAVPARH